MATYRRFDAVNRVMHGFLMLSFLGLSATGLPLLFGQSRWAATLADVLGGIEVCGRLHRLSAAVLTAARTRLALAPWTLPHEMARLVLAEQIYRAGTIGRGEPYNK